MSKKGGRAWQVKQTVDPRRVLHMSLEQTIMRAHKNPLSRQLGKMARECEGMCEGGQSTRIRMCQLILGHAQQTRQRGRGRGSMETKSPLVNFGAVVVVAVVAFLPAQRAQTDSVAVFRFVWVFLFSGQPLATCHMALATCHLPHSTKCCRFENEKRALKKSQKEAAAATGCDFVIRAGNAPRLAFDTHSKYVCMCECVPVWVCVPSWTWSWGTFESFLVSSNWVRFKGNFHCPFPLLFPLSFPLVFPLCVLLTFLFTSHWAHVYVRDAAWTLRIRRLSQDKPIEAAAATHTAKILTPDPTPSPPTPMHWCMHKQIITIKERGRDTFVFVDDSKGTFI